MAETPPSRGGKQLKGYCIEIGLQPIATHHQTLKAGFRWIPEEIMNQLIRFHRAGKTYIALSMISLFSFEKLFGGNYPVECEEQPDRMLQASPLEYWANFIITCLSILTGGDGNYAEEEPIGKPGTEIKVMPNTTSDIDGVTEDALVAEDGVLLNMTEVVPIANNSSEWGTTTSSYFVNGSELSYTDDSDNIEERAWDLLTHLRSDGWQLADRDMDTSSTKTMLECRFGALTCNTSVSSENAYNLC